MMTASEPKKQTTDQEIRTHLRYYLSDKTSRVVEEFDIENGAARADLVDISDAELHGYEIKSDVDSLVRLTAQVQFYNKAFSKVTVVVGLSHIKKIAYLVPDWWGIILAKRDINGSIAFSRIRQANTNPYMDTASMLRLLFKEEISIMVKDCDVKIPSKSTKENLVHMLSSQLDEGTIHQAVTMSLFRRYCA